MALIVSLLAIRVAIGVAAKISDIPVRRQVPVRSESEPVSLAEGEQDQDQDEDMRLSELHKDWPVCQELPWHNWANGIGSKGAEQHLEKLAVTPGIASAQDCAEMCGAFGNFSIDNKSVPCAGWSWVEKSWASEFGGFQSCAMFGFVANDPGAFRFPVNVLTFQSNCCFAGTPCKGTQTLSPYLVSHDRMANNYRHVRGYERMATKMQDRLAKDQGHISKAWLVLTIAAVFGLGVIAGVFFVWWKARYENEAKKPNLRRGRLPITGATVTGRSNPPWVRSEGDRDRVDKFVAPSQVRSGASGRQ